MGKSALEANINKTLVEKEDNLHSSNTILSSPAVKEKRDETVQPSLGVGPKDGNDFGLRKMDTLPPPAVKNMEHAALQPPPAMCPKEGNAIGSGNAFVTPCVVNDIGLDSVDTTIDYNVMNDVVVDVLNFGSVSKTPNNLENEVRMAAPKVNDSMPHPKAGFKVPFADLFLNNNPVGHGYPLYERVVNGQNKMVIESDRVEDIHKTWDRSLVGFIAGKNVGKLAIIGCCKSWKVKLHIHFETNGWVVMEFEKGEDIASVLANGPYMIYGRPFILKAMPPYFTFDNKEASKVPMWVRLPRLPVALWNADILSELASWIGRPIRTDHLTQTRGKISFARVFVEVDMSKDLTYAINIELPNKVDYVQIVEYENIPLYCKGCNMVGHSDSNCERNKQRVDPTNNGKEKAGDKHGSVVADRADGGVEAGFQTVGLESLERVARDSLPHPTPPQISRKRPHYGKTTTGKVPPKDPTINISRANHMKHQAESSKRWAEKAACAPDGAGHLAENVYDVFESSFAHLSEEGDGLSGDENVERPDKRDSSRESMVERMKAEKAMSDLSMKQRHLEEARLADKEFEKEIFGIDSEEKWKLSEANKKEAKDKRNLKKKEASNVKRVPIVTRSNLLSKGTDPIVTTPGVSRETSAPENLDLKVGDSVENREESEDNLNGEGVTPPSHP